MQPQIILLKDGTENSQGKPQLVSNINACQVVVEAVGDGTTSVVLIAGEILKQIKPFVDEGVHPRIIIRALRRASQLAVEEINRLAVKIEKKSPEQSRELLERCAATALSSKLVAQQKGFFSHMVVDAVLALDELLPLDMIGIKKVAGGALEESLLVKGVAFKKTFSYAGFEMQPKTYKNPKIALLNIELELKAERDNAEIRLDNVAEYQKVVDAEWGLLYEKLEKIHASGAQVVLSKLPIGDVATQWFADRDMFCAGRVVEEDLKRTMRACGGAIMTTAHDLNDSVLGTCDTFIEKQIGGERYNLFEGCRTARTCTLVLRGGGGAIEMELSRMLREHSRTIAGKEQLLIGAVAKALEIIPRQLCDNAGFDATNILNKLRQKHATGHTWYGVDITREDVADNFEACVWEPSIVRVNALTAACEAACLILSVDETIKNPKSGDGGPPGMPGRGRGRPM
ncbi:hypothetical protein B566_EDAN014051 [Ephemera danica]|nr:hypothetical protein B566_EDAN014051 [Ephemera danica]